MVRRRKGSVDLDEVVESVVLLGQRSHASGVVDSFSAKTAGAQREQKRMPRLRMPVNGC